MLDTLGCSVLKVAVWFVGGEQRRTSWGIYPNIVLSEGSINVEPSLTWVSKGV